MAISKVTSASITTDAVGPTQLNEASNYDFTGTVTGASPITEADMFRTNASTAVSADTDTLITAWARNTPGTKIGTGMSVSSGTWTFPTTGIYKIDLELSVASDNATRYIFASLQKTSDNSSYTEFVKGYGNIYRPSSTWWGFVRFSTIFDCTNTTNDKVRMYIKSNFALDAYGGTESYSTGRAIFTRIGDT